MIKRIICASCGKETHEYAMNGEGKKLCYDCCGVMEKKQLLELKPKETIVFYLSGHEVINWCGTMRIKCIVKEGKHNIAGVRHDCWFKIGDKCYHGVQYGDFSELCYIKRVKA